MEMSFGNPDDLLDKMQWPGLREDVHLLTGQPDAQGRDTGMLHDALNGKYYTLNLESWRLISLMNEGHSVKDTWQIVQEHRSDDVGPEQLMAFFEFLEKNYLIRGSAPSEVKKQSLKDTLMHSYVFFRIPLLHPEKFLQKTLHLVQAFYSQWTFYIIMVFALVGLFQLSQQWDLFWNSFNFLTTSDGIMLSLVCLVVLKLGHEFSHAYTATQLNQRVRQMGVAFIVFWPILFTDTTDAWRLERKGRARIDLAGVKFELSISLIALGLWGLFPEGLMKSLCFYLFTVASISTIFVNLNPFMRFDGYYLMSHFLKIDNLQPRTFAWLNWAFRRAFFDWKAPASFDTGRTEKQIYLWYGIGCLFYRVFITFSIALAVYTFFFNTLGLLLVCVEVYLFLLRPLIKQAEFIREHRDLIGHRSWPRYITITAILALILIPLPTTRSIPAVVAPAWIKTVYAQEDGILNQALPEQLPANILFSNPELENSISEAHVNLKKLNLSLQLFETKGALAGSKVQLKSEIKAEEAKLISLLTRQKKLSIYLPKEHHVLWSNPYLTAQQWVSKQTPLLRYVQDENPNLRIKMFVTAYDKENLKSGQEIRFYSQASDQIFILYIKNIEPFAVTALDYPSMASSFGGPLASVGTSAGNLTLKETRYAVWAESTVKAQYLPAGIPGSVRLDLSSQSILMRTLKAGTRIWKQESWQ
ncbi:MAG: hypothetical protein Q9M28_11910 [Mariprofundaceae bacterium]|nr:hypothetical protein [Mariprofundaceae bacterium]